MQKTSLFISKQKLFWINLAVWVILTLLAILKQAYYMMRAGNEFMWGDEILWTSMDYLSMWILSFAIYGLFLRTHRMELKPFLSIHLPLSLIFGLVNLSLSLLLTMGISRLIREPKMAFGEAFIHNIQQFLSFSLNGVIVYWLVMIGLFALNFYARYKNQTILSLELESRLNQSQLQTLKMQLQPHFLFNALNTISMMVRSDKGPKAVQMISGLSDLLRESLAREGEQFVSFEEEVKLVKKYLEIEEVRFQDRLSVHFEIDPASNDLTFPSLLLQPILENAFKHGISQSLEDAILRVKSEVIENEFHVWIDNSGPTLPDDWVMKEQKGIGLTNTCTRLKQLYGEEFSFSVFNLSLSGVSTHLVIPARPISAHTTKAL
ncbi:MAG: histidine kinase [Bacteroidota bacterium]